MVKQDHGAFMAMMDDLLVESRQSILEDLEPDYEYIEPPKVNV